MCWWHRLVICPLSMWEVDSEYNELLHVKLYIVVHIIYSLCSVLTITCLIISLQSCSSQFIGLLLVKKFYH